MPEAPRERTPYSFPFVATVAPVVCSGLIWAVTQSAFALVFAFLGPLVALGSLADATVQGRRLRKKERRRFERDVAESLAAIADRHEAERAALNAAHPGISILLARPGSDADRWNVEKDVPVLVPVGRGDVRSELTIDGAGVGSDRGEVSALLESVMDAAIRLEDAPMVIDARLGVGICGPPASARAAARACVLQLARAVPPGVAVIRFTNAAEWNWLDSLPHRSEVTDLYPQTERVEFLVNGSGGSRTDADFLVAMADCVEQLPRRCRIVIITGSGRAATVSERGSVAAPREVQLEFAAVEDACAYAAQLRECAETEGLLPADATMPELVLFTSLESPMQPPRPHNDSLRCAAGRSATGTWEIDLVADGPHAVIGGTTCSGKSELLVTWVLSIAARYSPRQVTFLLVDFKGGASFAAVASLPHSVGLITDLDRSSAHRALESLRAEVLYREQVLIDAGARAIGDLPDSAVLARLVIVVDEFAALGNDFPELHELFADLAARGRSLGVHLILCTQRPAEALRDSIMANCTLRISLRLNNRADSVAVIGTGDAADLPRHPRGRALAILAGEKPTAVQVALADGTDADRIGRLWPGHAPVRRPWCEPLPRMLAHDRLDQSVTGLAFGMSDLPGEQRQETAAYVPERHGNFLVLGAHGAGKSTLIRAIAASALPGMIRWIPDDIEGAWDAVVEVAAAVSSGRTTPCVVVFDDADSLVARLGQDHQLEFVDLLSRVMRDGPRNHTSVVLTAQRVPALLQSAVALCDSRLLLRLPNRQDHLLAGGSGDQYDSRLPAGGGFWRDNRVQIGYLPPLNLPTPSVSPPIELRPGAMTAVVSTSVREAAAAFAGVPAVRVVDLVAWDQRETGGAFIPEKTIHTVVVGDPISWQGAWAAFATIHRTSQIVFDRCSVGEFRALTGTRRLPQPLSSATRSAWLLTPNNELGRASLPYQAPLPNRALAAQEGNGGDS